MRLLGIDYGAKRVGLAVSSEGLAFPHGVLANDAALFDAVARIAAEEKVSEIVVGDTRSYGSRENPISKDADAFVERLKAGCSVPVVSVSEAGSSAEAARYAPRGKRDDAAAALILQRYLDARSGALHSEHE